MLHTGTLEEGDRMLMLDLSVRTSDRLPTVFRFWQAELARDQLRLGVYFGAVAVMLQVPGAAAYRCVGVDQGLDDDSWRLVDRSDKATLLDVLACCFDELGVGDLMKQVPGGGAHVPRPLSAEWRTFIERSRRIECGVLNIIAGCLDALIVRPGMAEIDRVSEQPWWLRWRLRPE